MTAVGPNYQQFNPFPVKENPGYDILVSLSQRQLQRQLDLLYNSRLPSTSLPVPGSTGTNGPNEYLISHQLRLLLPRTSKKSPGRVYSDTEREGVLGHVLCPEIVLIPGKYRSVQLKFTFTSVDEADVQKPYSANRFFNEIEEWDIYTIDITGWSFTFEADLSTSKPMDIMKDILNLAKDPASPVILPEKTQEQFHKLDDITKKEPTVDSRTFLASSIFCLFESTQIANSFKLTNNEGLGVSPDDFQTIQSFSKTVTTYFASLKNSGLPTAQNPFVLGYAITQKIATVSAVTGRGTTEKPAPTTDKTPKYFIPRRYDISVTPPPAGYGVPGSINFCIQTYRDEAKDQADVDIIKAPNAGVSYYTPQQNIVPGGMSVSHDGVMVLSRQLFLNKYAVSTFNPAFYLNPRNVLESFGCETVWDITRNREIFSDDQPRWERTHSVMGNTLEKRSSNGIQVLYKIPQCTSKLIIGYSSDWSKAVTAKNEGDFKSDSIRQAYLSVTTEAITTIEHKGQAMLESKGDDFAGFVNGIKGLIGGAMGLSGTTEDLPLMHRVITTQRYRYVFRFAAGPTGAWDVQLSVKETVQPKLKNNGKELDFQRVQQEPGLEDCGTFVHVVKGTVQGLLEDAFGLDNISENLATDDQGAQWSGPVVQRPGLVQIDHGPMVHGPPRGWTGPDQ